MLRIHASTTPASAKSYFNSADYYSEGQELIGQWRGKGAARLGLTGEIQKEDWERLCDNRDPATGRSLTPRQKANRRVGYDFTFDVPKSVSLLYGITGDERLLAAFRSAVQETMQEIEGEAQARVRIGGKDEDRTTGNLVWGEYVHFTARPIGGVPDPQLHAHCFAFNATFDPEESRWKAAQLGAIKHDAPYFQAAFDARMARKLADLGLPIARTRTSWEIDGLGRPTLEKFARRTNRIEAVAKARGINDPKAKASLGATLRERKAKGIPMGELREHWRQRLNDQEAAAMDAQARGLGGEAFLEVDGSAREAVSLAAEHCFERASVMPERTVLAEALKRAVGKASLSSVLYEFRKAGFITADRDGQRLITTREVLAEEARMIAFARDGRGKETPLGGSMTKPHMFSREWLNAGQRAAVNHVLHSPDRVMVIRGAAGVGKTSMMQEAVEAIQAHGTRVLVFAPSAAASRGVLRTKNFADADTVARLLVDEKLQEQARGQVIWVDEAGLLGTRSMGKVFELANKLDTRVILSGDRRQHGSIERGAALRLLEEEAGLVPAEIKEIQRQKDKYKDAVQLLSEGRTEDGFRALDKLKWIKEGPDEDRDRRLAADYVAAISEGKSTLVVSPTHAEGERVTEAIRSALRRAGRLDGKERPLQAFEAVDLTTAQRSDPLNYTPDSVLVFHQNAKGFRKGERVRVGDLAPESLPLDQAERFQVYRPKQLAISAGDLVRITKNGQTADRKHALNNGAVYAVKGFTAKGEVVLANGWTLAKNFGHLAYGYVVTSHASQGRDVQRVLIGQSSTSFPASSQEQFYVSISRGTESVTVYTDNKLELLDAVKRSDPRLSATELVSGKVDKQRQREQTKSRDQSPTPTRPAQGHPTPWRTISKMLPIFRGAQGLDPRSQPSNPHRHDRKEASHER